MVLVGIPKVDRRVQTSLLKSNNVGRFDPSLSLSHHVDEVTVQPRLADRDMTAREIIFSVVGSQIIGLIHVGLTNRIGSPLRSVVATTNRSHMGAETSGAPLAHIVDSRRFDWHHLVFGIVLDGQPLLYAAGARWSSSDFSTLELWESYMREFSRSARKGTLP